MRKLLASIGTLALAVSLAAPMFAKGQATPAQSQTTTVKHKKAKSHSRTANRKAAAAKAGQPTAPAAKQ